LRSSAVSQGFRGIVRSAPDGTRPGAAAGSGVSSGASGGERRPRTAVAATAPLEVEPLTSAVAVFTDNLPPEALKDLAPRIAPRAAFFIYGEHGQGGSEKAPNPGFYAEAGEPMEIWEVPGAQHVGGITTRPAEYERRVLGFFDRALLGPPR
jgi:hypothetical protein